MRRKIMTGEGEEGDTRGYVRGWGGNAGGDVAGDASRRDPG